MDGMGESAETAFNMPVRVGTPLPNAGAKAGEFCSITAAGLVEYGSIRRASRGFGRQVSENIFKRAYQSAMDFVNDYF